MKERSTFKKFLSAIGELTMNGLAILAGGGLGHHLSQDEIKTLVKRDYPTSSPDRKCKSLTI